jgi:adenylate cyclase
MSMEIERKFLVANDGWRDLATRRVAIRQAYLTSNDKVSLRVRTKDDGSATVTIKTREAKLRRLELEYPVPALEAESLISLRCGSLIEKERFIVPYAGCTWEIDLFAGENAGLVIAEVELQSESQQVDLPPWVGAEITGRNEYYNSSLALRPFGRWQSEPRTRARR